MIFQNDTMTNNSKFMFMRSYLFFEIFVQFVLFTHSLELELYPDPVFSNSDKSSPANADNLKPTFEDSKSISNETGGKDLIETVPQNRANETILNIGGINSSDPNFNQNNSSVKLLQNNSNSTDNKTLIAYNDEYYRPVKALEWRRGSRYYRRSTTEVTTTTVTTTTPPPPPSDETYIPDDPLNKLERVPNMLGIELKTAVYIVAALGIVHVFFYGCTLFMNLSYMLVTIWVLVLLYSTLSLILFIALPGESSLVIRIWIWYSLFFVVMMCIMMILVAAWFCVRAEYSRLSLVFLGFAWYGLTMYFILVVNSYRMQIEERPVVQLSLEQILE